ncbi:hypothetical protein GLYMA_05G097601v4 [Glycine max]|nr:hypothetical protein GLYMA_05G097601v4 [Glycine max]KAH1133628.1 hypothetical protein GYH30_012159 [Glycine max]
MKSKPTRFLFLSLILKSFRVLLLERQSVGHNDPNFDQPRRLLGQPLEHRNQRLSRPNFHFRGGNPQHVWPRSWWQQRHQRRLLQPSRQ